MNYPENSDLQKLESLRTRLGSALESYRNETEYFFDDINSVANMVDIRDFILNYQGKVHNLLLELADEIVSE